MDARRETSVRRGHLPGRGLVLLMTHFCPSCWETVESGATRCPHCLSDLRALDQRAFTAKLIDALRHPEPGTQRRAARILGERREATGVAALGQQLRATADPLLAGDLATALGMIGGREAEELLVRALRHPAFLVRQAALEGLVSVGGALAARALEHAARDPSPAVRRAAAELEKERQKLSGDVGAALMTRTDSSRRSG